MRRPWVLAALALFASGTLVPAEDLTAVKQRGTLRMLSVVVEEEPEFVSSQAERPGFDREVLEGFARPEILKKARTEWC